MVSFFCGYTIYRNPSDYPDKIVVRRWTIEGGDVRSDDLPTAVVDSIEAARNAIPQGLFRLDRHASDTLSIVETWI